MLYNTAMNFEKEKVLTWLKDHGRSQSWLAAQIGVTVVSVNRWLNGHLIPSLEKIERIEMVLRGESPGSSENQGCFYGGFDSKILRDWLEEQNRSQSWLADKLGVHPGTVNRWVQGRLKPSSDKLAVLERLMYEGSVAKEECGALPQENLRLKIPDEIWALVENLASLQGLSTEEYVKNIAARLAEELAILILKAN